jgi:hypothetical protein
MKGALRSSKGSWSWREPEIKGELRALFKQELGAERARDLKEQMLAAGLPI